METNVTLWKLSKTVGVLNPFLRTSGTQFLSLSLSPFTKNFSILFIPNELHVTGLGVC